MKNPKGGLTIKQEKFARAYIETGNASEALRRSYNIREGTKPDSVWNWASRIRRSPQVSARINELKALNAQKLEVSVGSITRELESARLMAVTQKLPSAAVSASMAKAKLHGLVTDKSVHLNAEIKSKEPLSMYELAKTIAFMLTAGSKEAEKIHADAMRDMNKSADDRAIEYKSDDE